MPVADYGEPNYWLTCIPSTPSGSEPTARQIRLALEAVDIESRPTWKPLHLQPVFAGRADRRRCGCGRHLRAGALPAERLVPVRWGSRPCRGGHPVGAGLTGAGEYGVGL